MKVVSVREWDRHEKLYLLVNGIGTKNTKAVLICSPCSFCQHIMMHMLIIYVYFVICSRQLYCPLLEPETKSILFSELFMGFISVSYLMATCISIH